MIIFDWAFLALLAPLAHTAWRLRAVRQEVASVRQTLTEQIKRNVAAQEAEEKTAAKLNKLDEALRSYQAAALEINAPKIKRLAKTNPERVALQDKHDAAANNLATVQSEIQSYLEGMSE